MVKVSPRYMYLIFVFLLLCLALFLRLYHLNIYVPSLYIDETAGHYLSSWKFSSPQLNIFEYIYAKSYFGITTFTWFLGLTPLGVRLPSAIYGALITLAIYYYAICLDKTPKTKIIAIVAFTIAIFQPWNFMTSRIGHAPLAIMLLLVIVHLVLFLKSAKLRNYIASLIPLFLSLFFYPTMVIIFPIIIVYALLITYRHLNLTQKRATLLVAPLAVLLLVALFIFRFGVLRQESRGIELAIWNDVNTTWETDKFRGVSWLSKPDIFSFNLPTENLSAKLVYNTATANINIFTRNYLSFFSPDFLFLRGDAILRHSTGQVGAFLPFLLPFMLYGAFIFFRDQTSKNKQLFLVWILISPIPAAITKDGAGYLLRAITMMPFLTYFCALGIVESNTLINKRFRVIYGILLTLVGLYSACYFLFGYFHVYPALSAKSYEYGFKELSDFQQAKNGESMLVIWDGYYPNLHFRFWQKTPFGEYHAFTPTDTVIGDSHFHKLFPNLYFSLPFRPSELTVFIERFKPKYLVYPEEFIRKNPDYLKLVGEPVETVLYPDQTPDFYIYDLTNAK